jgi:hypothetical protein
MDVVIVYESVFKNTHAIAEAIADGIRGADTNARATCLHLSDATPAVAAAADLLVVGGPTHMHGMSSGLSRRMGVKSETKTAAEADRAPTEHEPDAEGPGLREWFHQLPEASDGKVAAAFDTRIDNRHAGGAANGISRRLRHHGYSLVAQPEGFLVEDMAGPLAEGELSRAAAWGAALLAGVDEPLVDLPHEAR